MKRKDIRCFKKSAIASAMAAVMVFSTVAAPTRAAAKPVNSVNSVEKESNTGTAKALSNIDAFTVSDVVLTDAYCVNATKKEIAYLKKFDVDRLLAGFRETAGLDLKGKTRYKGWEDSLIGGHCVGHYMSALAQAYSSINVSDDDKAALLGIIKPLINGLEECQEQSGSYGNSKAGYIFGATLVDKNNVETQFDNVEKNKTNLATESWVPWYTMHKILAGLLDIARIQSDDAEVNQVSATALDMARKLGEWTYNRASQWSEATRATVLNIEYGGMNDALYELYDYTKGSYANAEHFKTAAHLFDEDTLFERICNSAEDSDVLSGLHANTTIPKFLGALKGYVICGGSDGTAKYMEYAEKFWDRVIKHHTYITGDNSEWEHFRTVDALNKNRTNCNCETCNAYNMLKMSRLLFQLTGEKKYADFYENAFQNTILSSQNPETGMTTYFQPMATGYFKVYSTEFTKFWCCTGSGMESFTKLNDSIYFYRGDNLIVNQFTSSELHWSGKNLKVTQESGIPNTDETVFTVSKLNDSNAASEITLYLRIPDWASDQVSIKVNGESLTLTEDKITTNGYAIVSGVNAGDSVSYTIPMEVVPYTLQDAEGSVFAFKYGPVVLSAELEAVDWESNSTVTGVEVTIPASKKVDSETVAITAPVESIEDFMTKINTYMVRDTDASDLVFYLQGTNTNLKFTTHYKQYKNRYGIYWYFVQDEESISQAVISAKETARLDRNKIGEAIRPGYTQDETTLTDNGSVANASPNYRYAKEGGSFSYKVMVEPDRDNYLVASFYKEDYDNGKTIQIRAGEDVILFSGTLKKLAQTYQANVGGETFTVDILLPKQMLAENASTENGKKYLTITFSGAPGVLSEGEENPDSEAGKVVYFVDCGDYDPTTHSDGDSLGTRNSVTEQIFGKDEGTGYSWGIIDDTAKGVFTNHTWANEQISGDGVAKNVSNRYTKNQSEDSIDRHLEYDFELSAGTYTIEAAFINPWNVSSPVKVKADDTVLSEALAIPQDGCELAKGTVTLAEDGILKLTATAEAACINIAYIIITQGDETLYFVDCGDYDPTTLSDGDSLGTRNSVTEQVFGKDPVTGYSWGVIDDTGVGPKGILTYHTWANEQISGDGVAKDVSNRYTKDQAPSISRHLEYDFELSAGTYAIEAAFVNPWGVSSPVKVKADDTVLSEALAIPQNGCASAEGTVTLAEDGILKLTATAEVDCINIAYIIIEKEAEDAIIDTSAPTQESVKICATLYIRGAYSENAGLDGLKVMDMSNKDLTESVAVWDKEKKEITVTLPENYTEDVQVQFTLKDINGYISLGQYAIDDTKPKKFAMETSRKLEYPVKIYAEDHKTSENYTLKLIKQYTVDKNITYFVDCGDYNVTTVSDGDAFGTNNSVTEQIYGKDPVTGRTWGLLDKNGTDNQQGGVGNAVFTSYTWANEANPIDGLSKTDSYRYTKNQFEILDSGNVDGIRYLDYAFELDAGTYDIEIGMSDPWNCSSYPSIYLGYNDATGTFTQCLFEKTRVGAPIEGTFTTETTGEISLNFRGTGETTKAINVSYIIIKPSGVDDNKPEYEMIYFVDCGDYDVTTVSAGDDFGTRNSVTDQIFGKDEGTGYSWGIVDDTEASERHGDAEKGVFTNHTWANEQIDGDGVSKTISNRYTKDQWEDGIDRHLEYDFELSAGTYVIEAAFVNPWNVSSPVKVKANDTVLCEALEIPWNGCKTVKDTVVLEKDGVLKLTATAEADVLCINIAYIMIKSEKASSDDNKPDDNNPGTQNPGSSSGNNGSNNTINSGNTSNGAGNNTNAGNSSNGADDNNNSNNNGADNDNNDSSNNGADNTTNPPADTQNPTVVTEEKPDGTIITTTTQQQPDGTIITTIVETKPDGTIATTKIEKQADGSSIEEKEVKAGDGSATLIAKVETNTSGQVINGDAIIRTGISSNEGTVEISKELLESVADIKLSSVIIAITDTTVSSADDTTKKNYINITVKIPSSDAVGVEKIILTKESIQTAKTAGKGLKVNIKENGNPSNNYTVAIPAKQLAKIGSDRDEVNLNVNADRLSNVKNSSTKKTINKLISNGKGKKAKTVVASIEADKTIKAGFKITFPITKKVSVSAGSNVYVYKYNSATGKLEEMANCKQKVSVKGTVTIPAVTDMNYVISAKKLSGSKIATIRDNISVKVSKKTAKPGKQIKTKVSLPDTVSTKPKFGTEKAKITYKSSNNKIVSVSSSGLCKAKKKGVCKITTTIKLESGQKVTRKIKLTIK